MSDFKPTKEQQAIIDAPIENILVSAAAGSGKTTVLVNRIINEIVMGTLSIDRLLVVTFTKDAAAHMQEKIESALKKKIKELRKSGDNDTSEKLIAQLDLLPNSYIQTIDSFCSRVIKEKGYVIADNKTHRELIESGNILLDENQKKILVKNAVTSAIFKAYALNEEEDSAFIRLTERFGDGRTDGSIESAIIPIFEKLRAMPDYLSAIRAFVAKRKAIDDAGEAPWLKQFATDIRLFLEECDEDSIEDCRQACHDLEFYPGLAGDIKKRDKHEVIDEWFDRFVASLRPLYKVAQGNDDKALFEELGKTGATLNSVVYKCRTISEKDVELKKEVVPVMTAVAQIHLLLSSVLKCSTPAWIKEAAVGINLPENYYPLIVQEFDEIMEMQKENTKQIEALVSLLELVDAEYSRLKVEFRSSDYADQEYAALEILKKDEASTYYRDKFQEIYVDEYQDNSNLQDEIIKYVSDVNKGNVFRVGDKKQSIYRFRNSDPHMFIDKMNEYENGTGEKGEVFYLSSNHRSTREILDFVNFIFGQIMTLDGTQIDYDGKEKFDVDVSTKHGVIPNVVIADKTNYVPDIKAELDVEGDDTSSDEEGQSSGDDNKDILSKAVLDQIKKYLNEDPEHKMGDICVITKKTNMASYIAGYLDDMGYKAACIKKKQIFDDIDIHGIINLIILLGNEQRDECLYGVLVKGYRFSNFTFDEVALINAYARKNYPQLMRVGLIERLRVYADKNEGELADRVNGFLDVFDDLRMTVRTSEIDDVVEKLYKVTGLKATLQKRKETDKLDYLKDFLVSNFKRMGTDISLISQLLDDMKLKIDKPSLEFAVKGDDFIKVMNVHKTKGLEFPYVIFAVDDSKENEDHYSNIVFDRKIGFVADNYSRDDVRILTSPEMAMLKNEMTLENNAEILRLLYVALTRAEKKLTVVTCSALDSASNVEKFLSRAYERTVSANDEKFGRMHWLNGNGKMGYALFSGLMRATCAASMNEVMPEDLNTDFNYGTIPYDGFTFEVYKPSDADAKTVSGSSTSGEQYKSSLIGYDEMGMPVFGDYIHQSMVDIPFKVSVTAISDGKVEAANHVDLKVKGIDDYEDRINNRLSAAGKGTVVHTILRFADLEELVNNPDGFVDQIESLISDGVFKGINSDDVRKTADEFKTGIVSFASSDIGKRLSAADQLFKAEYEKPIVFAVPVDDGTEDFALVQGIIDATFEENGNTVIIDYKTDNLGDMSVLEMIEETLKKHSFQINCYEASLKASGKTVSEKYIYLLRYALAVKVQ